MERGTFPHVPRSCAQVSLYVSGLIAFPLVEPAVDWTVQLPLPWLTWCVMYNSRIQGQPDTTVEPQALALEINPDS